MDILLLSVTVASLAVALGMTVVAWRLARAERGRSAARVAALAAAAGEPESTPKPQPKAVPVAEPVSEPVAVGDSRPAAPWAPARVSAFSPQRPAASRAPELSLRPATAEDLFAPESSVGEGFLGSTVTTPPSSGRQRGLAVAALILFGLVLTGGYWTVFGQKSAAAGAAAIEAREAAPLELISLRHERRGSRLAVTGLVRNPAAGVMLNKLSAVVFLFDQQGSFITSARADLDFLKLTPGDESPFVINLDAPSNVARYRVSFRNDAGVVPHVDRRGQNPIADEPAVNKPRSLS